ncbi:SCO-spondin-like isoform X2 [Hydractinia symbiolongicarpus]|uniref:SCO-spondin-like isoform X2 n=1 Tax=Hydractinia symbiolongicarpus TaxID=13093 RepID=UPI00254AD4BF|nr:SCO-spondin-like isoform X2 [Hydractinia symbiolongicarpus]
MCTRERLLCCVPYLLVIPLVINVCEGRVVFDINKEKTRSLKRTEDASLAAVVPKLPFPVFGNNVNRFYFRTSGFITFHAPNASQPADTSGIHLSYITPFWADVNEHCNGDIKLRESLLSQEFQTARDVIVRQREIPKFNANYMLLVEWRNMFPGHCYYPRTQFQAALVTDGCASYVIFSTSPIRLGIEETTISGDIRGLNTIAEENQVVSLGGENICTGQNNGDVVLNPLESTNRTYYRCGQCSAEPLQTCPSGQKYDMQCNRCILKAFPNCSSSDSRCNGRSNGYVLGLEGHNDCTGYYECQTQVGLLRKCPQQTYFNGTACVGNLDTLTCQHPDCLPGGRQNRVGDYPLTPGNQCSASYYHCNSSSYRTTRSCQISVTGAYFGLQNNAWQCISGDAPLLCGHPDSVCIGKSVTLDGPPFQKDPLDSYCRGYIICTGSGAITATCGASQFYNVTARTCQPNFPFHQGCWRDGGISSWSSWSYAKRSSCSVTCGPGGIQLLQRTRSCTDPAPLEGGSTCSGVSFSELKTANCQSTPPACEVHGAWSAWVNGSCSQTCGYGTRLRTRNCTNPAPAHGGSACPGVSTTNISCNDRLCPIHGSWGAWVNGSCSQTCGYGTRLRTRNCTNPAPAHGGSACPGVSTTNILCNDRPCPIHGSWGAWVNGSCSQTCGNGTRPRTRNCTNPAPAHGGSACPGVSTSSISCNDRPCPIHGSWGAWVNGSCSQTCGNGTRPRTRNCTNPAPAHGGSACPGVSTSSISCNDRPCPIHGSWGAWVNGSCSQTCGNGTRPRTRNCTNPAPAHGGSACPGVSTTNILCNDRPCPIHGSWGAWVNGSCSQTCGNGTRPRTRNCTNPAPAHGGSACPGVSTTNILCNDRPCPIHGSWGAWVNGSCSQTCGYGTRLRTRNCANPAPAHGGSACPGVSTSSISCNDRPCPIHGSWGAWVNGSCSQTCGNGTRPRTRNCTNPAPAHGGSACPGVSTTNILCNDRPCPIHGSWGAWVNGSCSQTCGNGTRPRTRNCTNPAPAHGGSACPGVSTTNISCNDKPCPVNGNWTMWTNWTACSKSCDNGTRIRLRECVNPAPSFGGDKCTRLDGTMALEEASTERCNTDPCFRQGGWSNWFNSTGCSQTCGNGIYQRNRTCDNPTPIGENSWCVNLNNMTALNETGIVPCLIVECPVNGSWTMWTNWTACSKSCDNGTRIRLRECVNPAPSFGGDKCTRLDGTMALEEASTERCNTDPCFRQGGWSDWFNSTGCSQTCGNGIYQRNRTCDNPTPIGENSWCVNLNNMTALNETGIVPCLIVECPVHGGWSEWSSYRVCSATCDKGTYSRNRTCNNPAPAFNGSKCLDSTNTTMLLMENVTEVCQIVECIVPGDWSDYVNVTECSKSCGAGTVTQERYCNNPPPRGGGIACEGLEGPALFQNKTLACNTNPCPVNGTWGNWTEYSPCSVTCGNGTKNKNRSCDNPAPAHGGYPCTLTNGSIGLFETKFMSCQDKECQVNGSWSEWSNATMCSKSCDNGTYTRERFCNNPPKAGSGSDCVGGDNATYDTETLDCNTHNCPIHGAWTTWDNSTCNATCDGGYITASRECKNPLPQYGGNNCTNSNGVEARTETIVGPCNTHSCPVHGGWSEWSSYRVCSATCDKGTYSRNRTCNNPAPAFNGLKCLDSTNTTMLLMENVTEVCQIVECIVPGDWSDYVNVTECSKSCGNGTVTQERYCNSPTPRGGGIACEGPEGPALFQNKTLACNTNPCPVNGTWGNWREYSPCSVTCGNGTKNKNRSCDNPAPAYGGYPCTLTNGSMGLFETKFMSCQDEVCPVNGSWSEWSSATMCSKSCGNGTYTRERFCNNPPKAGSGIDCVGGDNTTYDTETLDCNTHNCPIHGNWTEWSSYSDCSVTCGIGTKERNRTCTDPPPQFGGDECVMMNTTRGLVEYNSTQCNLVMCPIHGAWTDWYNSTCNATCGGGYITAFRECKNPPPNYGGNNCTNSYGVEQTGIEMIVNSCNNHSCPVHGNWSTWSGYTACSLTCGNGTKSRNRTCNNPDPMYGGLLCNLTDGTNGLEEIETMDCFEARCPDPYDCSFESSPNMKTMCNFTIDGPINRWSLHTGRTNTRDTGPYNDHTYGNSSGYYLYFEASGFHPVTEVRYPANDDFASIGKFPAFSGFRCMRFWLHMYGNSTLFPINPGEFRVIQVSSNGTEWDLLKRTEFLPDNIWYQQDVNITATSMDYEIRFYGRRVDYVADRAIDDVSFYDVSCPEVDALIESGEMTVGS